MNYSKLYVFVLINLFTLQTYAQNSTKEFWLNTGFSSLTNETVPAHKKKQQGLEIDVIVLKDSAWSAAIVRASLQKAQDYYWKNCKINLGPFEIYYGQNSQLNSINLGKDNLSPTALKLYRAKPDFLKPTVYFIGQEEATPGRTGVASSSIMLVGEEREKFLKKLGYNIPDDQALSISTNTILMFEAAIQYNDLYKYDVVTHEFAHILIGETDLYEPEFKGNILSGNYDGMNITPAQCEQIHSLWNSR